MKLKIALNFLCGLICITSCTSSPSHSSLGPCTSPPAPPAGSSCSVASAYLTCTFEGDGGVEVNENCLSDNINNCPDGNGLGGCTDVCPDDQYAAVCPGNVPPSSTCTLTGNVYCCSCG